MSDFRETIADRLERAADRMYNAGLLDEERSYRDAAALVRGGLSLEETRAIEQRMLSGQMPRLVNRLTALAAQGEYDGGGGSEGEGSTASATGEAAAEPVLTEVESGASQLLSTAPSTGLSNPFNSAQGGWMSSAQTVNPYTAVPGTGGDDWSAYTNGQNVDSYSGVAPVGDDPNSFTTGQNIDPSSGSPNTESYSGGAAPTQSPPQTGSVWNEFGFSGPPPSTLDLTNATAQNDVSGNSNIASDATYAGAVYLQVGTEQWSYGETVSTQGFATYYRFESADGSMYALQSTNDGSVVIYNTSDNSVVGFLDRSGTFVPPSGPQQLDSVTSPQQTTTPTPATNPQTASPQLTADPDAQLNAAIQQAVGPADPSTVNAGPPTSVNDVIAGTDLAPSDPTQGQPSDQSGSSSGESASQIQEENWDAAKAGMWDSVVDMAQGLMNMSLAMTLGPASLLGPKPSLDWAKFGPPEPTGDPVRDAELQDNYSAGGWVTTTVSLALPIGAEGILDSALAASSKLPALEGMGMGGGGRLIGPTEQWLASFGETTQSLGPELENSLASLEEEAVQEGTAQHHIFPQEFREQFEELGIDIDKYTIRLDQQTEHIPLHVGVNTEEWAGTYNDHWAVFLDQEGITAEDAFEFAKEFLNDLGLAGPEYPIVPFK
jgi:hypothetical protein